MLFSATHWNAWGDSFTFKMQDENIFEHIDVKCHVFICIVNLLTIVQPKHRPHNIIEHINVSLQKNKNKNKKPH